MIHRLGLAGVVNHGHEVESYPPPLSAAKQPVNSDSFEEPVPMLDVGAVPPAQSGRELGELCSDRPDAVLLANQQLPLLPG